MNERVLPILALLSLLAACSGGDDASSLEPVPVDLEPYLSDAPDPSGSVRVYEATDPSQLIEGNAATGQVGDYILENDGVRFVVEADRRRMNGCPWGGNVIDAEHRSDAFGGDILGEICLFLNADQTFEPEDYEILHDGSDGVGVLAVTGRTEVLDFLNLTTMIGFVLPGLGDLFTLRPEGLLPLTITQYFILRPGDPGVRVVTGLRNEGQERLDLAAFYLMLSGGGDGSYFNPLGTLGGFGYERGGLETAAADPLPFLALNNDDAGVTFMPRPDEELTDDLPIGGAYLTIFNVVATLLGSTDVLGTLLATPERLAEMPGALHLAPAEIAELEHWVFAGDGSLSTMLDSAYDELGVATGAVEGVARDTAGAPVPNARVSAVDAEGRTMNQTMTGADGTYAMRVPAGAYELGARLPGQVTPSPPSIDVPAGQTVSADEITVELPGVVQVQVRTPDEDPTPARVSLICDGTCPHKATSNERDVTFDQLPEHFAAVAWAGVDGEATLSVPAGDYQVAVSRGMEWSVWPADAPDAGGDPIVVEAGQTTPVNAEIARVVDTTGALSADFHVHAISSMDSTTPEEDRVQSFLAEGVDVIVSTDHDVISDFGPAIDLLGAGDHITSLVGTEITTSDLGHINGFPVERDPLSVNGGALDWGAGADPALPPEDIFEWIRSHPGEQVVQVNHPDVSYFLFSDVLRGLTFGDPDVMRLQASEPDPTTGDIGLWSDTFTALEVMNGHDMESYWGVARWWLTLIGRGHTPTGTAVTDTHTRYGKTLGATPRTYVFVDEGRDSVPEFDTAHFVGAVNGRRAIGTNGPLVRVEATNDVGASAGVGEVLETGGQPVTLQVTLQMPEWVTVDRVDMLMSSEDVITAPGEYDTDPIPPTESRVVELLETDLEEVASGHRRYRKTLDFEVDTAEDAYVVFIVRGSEDMAPVVPGTDVLPFAFTNPVLLDADGGGYDHPPLADLASTDPGTSGARLLRTETEERPLTREVLLEHIRRANSIGCQH
ncbi:MAG: CehA/McbA family metallohydrolase [Myxococcota bacterium]